MRTAEELRAMQAPFKERYRQEPESARVTLTARGRVAFETFTVEILRAGPAPTVLGIHPLAGGDGQSGCAAETLLEALVGCAGVSLAAVATAMGVPIQAAEIQADGVLDFRGTLGLSREIPVGFQEIDLKYEFVSEAPDELLAKAVQLSERYCVVAQTLPGVNFHWTRVHKGE